MIVCWRMERGGVLRGDEREFLGEKSMWSRLQTPYFTYVTTRSLGCCRYNGSRQGGAILQMIGWMAMIEMKRVWDDFDMHMAELLYRSHSTGESVLISNTLDTPLHN
jgi:hypothetical protein